MGMPMFGSGFDAEAEPATSATLMQAWQACIDVCIDVCIEALGPQR